MGLHDDSKYNFQLEKAATRDNKSRLNYNILKLIFICKVVKGGL